MAYTVGQLIHDLQCYSTNLTIEELLRDSAVTTQIADIFNSVPARTKTAMRKIVRNSSRGSSSAKIGEESHSAPAREAIRAIDRITSIALPRPVASIYEGWQQEPLSFWRSQGFCVEKTEDNHMFQVYMGMKKLETQRHSDTIIWRYFTLFFYDLVRLIGDGRKYLVSALQDRLVHAINSSNLMAIHDSTANTIQADLKRWASVGSKYDNIITALGNDNGTLMLLPSEVTDNIWENRLPMKGQCFHKAMEHLVGLGIRDVSRSLAADTLGTKIRKTMLEPFQPHSLKDQSGAMVLDSMSLEPLTASSTSQQTANARTPCTSASPALPSYVEHNNITNPQADPVLDQSTAMLFDMWATDQFEDVSTVVAPYSNLLHVGNSSSHQTPANTFASGTESPAETYTRVDISNFDIFQSQLDIPDFFPTVHPEVASFT